MTEIPTHRLAAWMRAQSISTAADVRLTRLSGGQSNPTFVVHDGARRLVLRKKPAGRLLASAHAIDREYRVMRALEGSGVPVPKMVGYCADARLLDTEFYLMEYLDGRVFMDPSLPGLDATNRRAMYRDMNRVFSALHAVDYRGLGLEDYGKPDGYLPRQISRWSRQCESTTVPLPTAMRRLMEWLPLHVPAEDPAALIHGDYRLDNLVFHPTEPRVIGVLDWELSTVGNPIGDFAGHCISWRTPPQLWRGIEGLDLQALGIPNEAEYLRMYETASGRRLGEHWDFYLAFSFFRMAAILHGIAQRAADGTAAARDAAETGAKAQPLAELGWACALRYKR